MSKTNLKQTHPFCVVCGTVFFGNPLDQMAESLVVPSGRWVWVCQQCCRVRDYADGALRDAATTWDPIFIGKKCERCGDLVNKEAINRRDYQWATRTGDWDFHCKNCYQQYQNQQYAYPCGVELIYCEGCQYVIPAKLVREADWAIDPLTGEAHCFFCKMEADGGDRSALPLSCCSKTQETIQPDEAGRNDYQWLEILTLGLAIVASGMNWITTTLLLVSGYIITAIVRRYARGRGLKVLLAKKKVQT